MAFSQIYRVLFKADTSQGGFGKIREQIAQTRDRKVLGMNSTSTSAHVVMLSFRLNSLLFLVNKNAL